MRTPTQAAHVLGKLLTYLGEDRILWGTDSIFYGSPQDQIEAMRAFEITPSFRDRYEYPKLTPYVKRKIFGLNAADLYGVEPQRRWWSFDRDDIRDLRRTFPDGNKPWGPATIEEFRRFHEYHQGWA
jgi:hypothetical protein